MANHFHPTAIVHPSAVLGDGNVVGPHVVIGPRVVVGDHNWFGPGACIGMVGDLIGHPAVGAAPWWEPSVPNSAEAAGPGGGGVPAVLIGHRNVVKEHVTVHAGSHRHTVVGNDCYLMPRAHLGHDCWLDDEVQLAPSAQVAGHVAIGRRTVVGMSAVVHQFSAIAPLAMVGMGAVVRGMVDVARTMVGDPARVAGLNLIGVARLLGLAEVPREASMALKRNDPAGVSPAVAEAVARWTANIDHR